MCNFCVHQTLIPGEHNFHSGNEKSAQAVAAQSSETSVLLGKEDLYISCGNGGFLYSASEMREAGKAATHPRRHEPSGVSEVITTKFSNCLCVLLSRSHWSLKSYAVFKCYFCKLYKTIIFQ